MSKRRRILLVLAVALLAAALYGVFSRPSEPCYEGRSLSDRLLMLDESPYEGFIAIRQIGTNALPFLLSWIRYEPPPWQGKLHLLLKRAGIPWRPGRHKQLRADKAGRAFTILGPRAKAAIPELIRFINESRQSDSACRSMIVLAYLGEGGLLGTDARPAVLALIQCLKDQHSSVRNRAALSLGQIKLEAGLVVPALTASLQDTDANDRMSAAFALGKFGSKARSATPALLKILNDPVIGVRKAATNTLLAIAPTTLTNVPPR